MLIRDVARSPRITAGDGTNLCELLHPSREGLDLPYSIAHASLAPGKASHPHCLQTSSEVYYILSGQGVMYVDGEEEAVGPGQLVLIPAGSWQHIRNTGFVDLVFLAVVHPFWQAQDEVLSPHPAL